MVDPAREQLTPRILPARITEVTLAECFAQEHGERFRFVPETGRWFALDKATGRWGEAAGSEVQALKALIRNLMVAAIHMEPERSQGAMRSLEKMQCRRALFNVLDLARYEGMDMPLAGFNADRWLLPVQNGVIDLKTGKIRDTRPDDYISRCLPVSFQESARCPQWEAFVAWAMKGSPAMVSFLQKAVGLSLCGAVLFHVFFFLFGTGRNGKSTFLNVLVALLGPLHRRLPSSSLMIGGNGGIPNDIARLVGARLVTASEVAESARLNEGLLKDLTGGDVITARHLHKEFFDFYPELSLWIAGNHRPVIRGTDTGIWRRVLMIPFSNSLREEEVDPRLTEKLESELPGILNWAISGFLAAQRDGLNPPDEVRAATDEYRSEQDLVGMFITDCCVTGTGNSVRAAELYREYQRWATDSGLRPVSQVRLAGVLLERGFSKSRSRAGVEYHGIRIRTGYDHGAV